METVAEQVMVRVVQGLPLLARGRARAVSRAWCGYCGQPELRCPQLALIDHDNAWLRDGSGWVPLWLPHPAGSVARVVPATDALVLLWSEDDRPAGVAVLQAARLAWDWVALPAGAGPVLACGCDGRTVLLVTALSTPGWCSYRLDMSSWEWTVQLKEDVMDDRRWCLIDDSASCVLDGVLYVAGGSEADDNISEDVLEYSFESASWRRSVMSLGGRTEAAAVVMGGEIWMLGGQEGEHLANLCTSADDVWIYSPQSGWRAGPLIDFPFGWRVPTSAAVLFGEQNVNPELVMLAEKWPLKPIRETHIVDRCGVPDKKILAWTFGQGSDQLCTLVAENFTMTDYPGESSSHPGGALVSFVA